MRRNSQPNIVFIFADEWPAHLTGYNGDLNCETPVLDPLAAESVNVTHAVSGMSVGDPDYAPVRADHRHRRQRRHRLRRGAYR
jgi:arylsulfatase A-like enzyme